MSVAATTFIRPIRDQVVVRVQEAEDKTPGGIVLPDQAKEKTNRGTVFAVGSGHLLSSGPQGVGSQPRR